MLIPRAELTSQEPSKSPAAYRRAAMTLSSSSVKAKIKRCRRGASVGPAGWSMSADATMCSPSVERASKKMPRRAEVLLRRACGQDRGRPDRVRPTDSLGSGMRASQAKRPRGERLRPPRAGYARLPRGGAARTRGPPGAPPSSQRGGQPGEPHTEWGAKRHVGELAMLEDWPVSRATGQDRRSKGAAVACCRGADGGGPPSLPAQEASPCEPKSHGGCQIRAQCHREGCRTQDRVHVPDRSECGTEATCRPKE